MSRLTQPTNRAPRLPARRMRAAGRYRRADTGVVTEMARSLLREAGDGRLDALRGERIESAQRPAPVAEAA